MLFKKEEKPELKSEFKKLISENLDSYIELLKADEADKDAVLDAVIELTDALGCPMPKFLKEIYRVDLLTAEPLRMLLAGIIFADDDLVEASRIMSTCELKMAEIKEYERVQTNDN